jgi:hypothetical protein
LWRLFHTVLKPVKSGALICTALAYPENVCKADLRRACQRLDVAGSTDLAMRPQSGRLNDSAADREG